MSARKMVVILAAVGLVLLETSAARASDPVRLTPAKSGWPLAHPLAESDIAPPPLSLMSDRPVNPAYVPGLPGLPQGRIVTDDYGVQRPKFDGVLIRKSRVEHGQVVIPAGGLVYLEDTWGGEVALRGEPIPVLGRLSTYIDYDMTIVVKENVSIPAGQSVVVGGQVYHYYATVGHERMSNHALHVRTIAGTDWEWAFGSPVLSTTQSEWWGTRFAQLYNQGQAREVTRQRMVFDWISGVRMDRLLLANEKIFADWARPGQEWRIGERTVRVVEVNQPAGTARIQVLEGGAVKLDKTLGPANAERLIEDTGARKALVFEYGDVAGFLVPWPETVRDGKANLKLYGKAFALRYGGDYAGDRRFAVYPVGCPTGHNFGFMLVNKQEIRIPASGSVAGPEGYFKIAVGKIAGSEIVSWHIEDRDGNPSVDLGGPGVTNVDLVLGQGRVTGQAILKDVGRAALARTYKALERPIPARSGLGAVSPGVGLAVLLAGLVAVSYEIRIRRGRAPGGR